MTNSSALTSRETIYQCIVDLSNVNKSASRQVISNITGLKMSIVDDHVKRLKDDGRILLVVNGVFEPAGEPREDRAVSITYLPKGECKLEIGDQCVQLTLREVWLVYLATAGMGLQFKR